MSRSKAVPLLPSQCGAFPPPAPLLSCGRGEASRVRFPVCGLRPLSAVRALVAQLGFPLFGPYHRTPQRPTVSLMESETAGGWVLPWTCLLFKKWVVFPASSLFLSGEQVSSVRQCFDLKKLLVLALNCGFSAPSGVYWPWKGPGTASRDSSRACLGAIENCSRLGF